MTNANAARRWSMRSLSRLEPLTELSARDMLTDTANRLQSQSSLLDQISSSLLLGTTTTSSSNASNNSTNNKVIKASSSAYIGRNYLLDWKGHLEREQIELRTMHSVDKTLRQLQVLHSDTLQLTNHLLESKRLWDNNDKPFASTTAHQTVVASSMEQIRSRHATTLETMADLVLSLRRCNSSYYYDLLPQSTLTSYLRGRLGVQILCDHYVGWDKKKSNGAVSVNCSLEPVLEEAKTEALHLCDAHYQTRPEIHLPTSGDHDDYPSLTIIRPWVHHALVEVLKNAMVASMDIISDSTVGMAPPSIRIELAVEGDYISILIHDQGPGLPGGATMKDFIFASSMEKWDRLDVQQSYATVRSPLSSLGVGLPSSQWLLQHFGGDLELVSNENGTAGCTAILRLPLNDDVPEYLPTSSQSDS